MHAADRRLLEARLKACDTHVVRAPALFVVLAFASCSSFEAAPDADASPEASSGTPAGCAGLFCASFDGPRFDDGWAVVAQPGADGILGSSFTRGEDRPHAGPAFLRFNVAPGGHDREEHYLRKTVMIASDVEKVSLEFAFRLTKPNGAGNDGKVDIVALEWGKAPKIVTVTEVIVTLEGGDRLVAAVEQNAVADLAPGHDFRGAGRSLSDSEWHVVRVEVAMPLAGDVRATYFLDGQEWEAHSFAPGPRPDPDGMQIRLGGRAYGGVFDETILDFDELILSR
jgi:hypothetical protein